MSRGYGGRRYGSRRGFVRGDALRSVANMERHQRSRQRVHRRGSTRANAAMAFDLQADRVLHGGMVPAQQKRLAAYVRRYGHQPTTQTGWHWVRTGRKI